MFSLRRYLTIVKNTQRIRTLNTFSPLLHKTLILKTKGKKSVKNNKSINEYINNDSDIQNNLLNDFRQNQLNIVNDCKHTIQYLLNSYNKLSPSLMDNLNIKVNDEYFNIKSLASVYAKIDQHSLIVNVFDSNSTKHIAKSIFKSNLDLNPQIISENLIRCPISKLVHYLFNFICALK